MKFKVRLFCLAEVTADTFEVEADNVHEARRLALDQVEKGVIWNYEQLKTDEPVDVELEEIR